MFRINKKVFSLVIFAGLLTLANTALAIEITDPLSVKTIPELIGRIITTIGGVIAGISTIMLVWSGILFIISSGDPTKITKAKTALIYAIAGLFIGLAASGIVELIKFVVGVK